MSLVQPCWKQLTSLPTTTASSRSEGYEEIVAAPVGPTRRCSKDWFPYYSARVRYPQRGMLHGVVSSIRLRPRKASTALSLCLEKAPQCHLLHHQQQYSQARLSKLNA
jgi:hypothetical protein